MNEIVVKKLGDILALSEVGNETFEKAKDIIEKEMESGTLEDFIEKSTIHAEEIRRIAGKNGKESDIEAMRGRASGKLRQMREIYLGEKWDNVQEVFEWVSIFAGISYGIWSVVKGIAESTNDTDLLTLSEEATTFYHNMLDTVAGELESSGEASQEVI